MYFVSCYLNYGLYVFLIRKETVTRNKSEFISRNTFSSK